MLKPICVQCGIELQDKGIVISIQGPDNMDVSEEKIYYCTICDEDFFEDEIEWSKE